jgi:phage baseplate assembly protein V
VTALGELFPALGAGIPLPGMAVGVVTSNADPEQLGRVKVRFPALSATVESAWAPVVTPMAGKERGLQVLPEAGDTVLVAFEQGDVNRPFVLGGFWNAAQHPPQGDNPGNAVRVVRSRSGHVIRLDDTEGAEKIEIVDKTGKNSITIDSASNKVTVTSSGDLEVKATGALALSGRSVEITAQQKLTATGHQGAELSTQGGLTVRGSTVDIN